MLLYRTKNFVSAETLIGAGLMTGGIVGNLVLNEKMREGIKETSEHKENKKLKDLLVQQFKKKNGDNNYMEVEGLDNACAVNMTNIEEMKERLQELSPEEKRELERLEKDSPELHAIMELIRKADPNKPAIICDPNFNEAGTISHEVGHTEYFDESENGRSKIIKVFHKMPHPLADGGWMLVFGGLAGVLQEVAAQDGGAKGVKWTKRIKNGLLICSSIDAMTVVACELAASKRGVDILRKLGASEEEIKKIKRNLALAAGTYVTGGLSTVGLGILAAKAGRKYMKWRMA